MTVNKTTKAKGDKPVVPAIGHFVKFVSAYGYASKLNGKFGEVMAMATDNNLVIKPDCDDEAFAFPPSWVQVDLEETRKRLEKRRREAEEERAREAKQRFDEAVRDFFFSKDVAKLYFESLTHSRTSCSDENASNADRGCSRCAMIRMDWEEWEHEWSWSRDQVRVELEVFIDGR